MFSNTYELPKNRTPANEVEQYKLPKARESDDLRPKTGTNWMREAKAGIQPSRSLTSDRSSTAVTHAAAAPPKQLKVY